MQELMQELTWSITPLLAAVLPYWKGCMIAQLLLVSIGLTAALQQRLPR